MATPGRTLGGYRIGGTLGHGSFGEVRLAIDRATGEKLAIKSIDKSNIADVADVERVSREYFILMSLEHRNVIKLVEVFQDESKLYLVMEYAGGGDLDALLKRSAESRLDEPTARRAFSQIVAAMRYCHRKHVIHRDLKPENILLSATHQIKVADFGLSNTVTSGSRARTPVGTPLYSAPEVLFPHLYPQLNVEREAESAAARAGAPTYNGSMADMWSVGVILYRMVFGRLPFPAENIRQLRTAILEKPLIIPADTCAPLEALVRGLLCTDPLQRPSAEDVMCHMWLDPFRGTLPELLLDPAAAVTARDEVADDTDADNAAGVDVRASTADAATIAVGAVDDDADVEQPSHIARCSDADTVAAAAAMPSFLDASVMQRPPRRLRSSSAASASEVAAAAPPHSNQSEPAQLHSVVKRLHSAASSVDGEEEEDEFAAAAITAAATEQTVSTAPSRGRTRTTDDAADTTVATASADDCNIDAPSQQREGRSQRLTSDNNSVPKTQGAGHAAGAAVVDRQQQQQQQQQQHRSRVDSAADEDEAPFRQSRAAEEPQSKQQQQGHARRATAPEGIATSTTTPAPGVAADTTSCPSPSASLATAAAGAGVGTRKKPIERYNHRSERAASALPLRSGGGGTGAGSAAAFVRSTSICSGGDLPQQQLQQQQQQLQQAVANVAIDPPSDASVATLSVASATVGGNRNSRTPGARPSSGNAQNNQYRVSSYSTDDVTATASAAAATTTTASSAAGTAATSLSRRPRSGDEEQRMSGASASTSKSPAPPSPRELSTSPANANSSSSSSKHKQQQQPPTGNTATVVHFAAPVPMRRQPSMLSRATSSMNGGSVKSISSVISTGGLAAAAAAAGPNVAVAAGGFFSPAVTAAAAAIISSASPGSAASTLTTTDANGVLLTVNTALGSDGRQQQPEGSVAGGPYSKTTATATPLVGAVGTPPVLLRLPSSVSASDVASGGEAKTFTSHLLLTAADTTAPSTEPTATVVIAPLPQQQQLGLLLPSGVPLSGTLRAAPVRRRSLVSSQPPVTVALQVGREVAAAAAVAAAQPTNAAVPAQQQQLAATQQGLAAVRASAASAATPPGVVVSAAAMSTPAASVPQAQLGQLSTAIAIAHLAKAGGGGGLAGQQSAALMSNAKQRRASGPAVLLTGAVGHVSASASSAAAVAAASATATATSPAAAPASVETSSATTLAAPLVAAVNAFESTELQAASAALGLVAPPPAVLPSAPLAATLALPLRMGGTTPLNPRTRRASITAGATNVVLAAAAVAPLAAVPVPAASVAAAAGPSTSAAGSLTAGENVARVRANSTLTTAEDTGLEGDACVAQQFDGPSAHNASAVHVSASVVGRPTGIGSLVVRLAEGAGSCGSDSSGATSTTTSAIVIGSPVDAAAYQHRQLQQSVASSKAAAVLSPSPPSSAVISLAAASMKPFAASMRQLRVGIGDPLPPQPPPPPAAAAAAAISTLASSTAGGGGRGSPLTAGVHPVIIGLSKGFSSRLLATTTGLDASPASVSPLSARGRLAAVGADQHDGVAHVQAAEIGGTAHTLRPLGPSLRGESLNLQSALGTQRRHSISHVPESSSSGGGCGSGGGLASRRTLLFTGSPSGSSSSSTSSSISALRTAGSAADVERLVGMPSATAIAPLDATVLQSSSPAVPAGVVAWGTGAPQSSTSLSSSSSSWALEFAATATPAGSGGASRLEVEARGPVTTAAATAATVLPPVRQVGGQSHIGSGTTNTTAALLPSTFSPQSRASLQRRPALAGSSSLRPSTAAQRVFALTRVASSDSTSTSSLSPGGAAAAAVAATVAALSRESEAQQQPLAHPFQRMPTSFAEAVETERSSNIATRWPTTSVSAVFASGVDSTTPATIASWSNPSREMRTPIERGAPAASIVSVTPAAAATIAAATSTPVAAPVARGSAGGGGGGGGHERTASALFASLPSIDSVDGGHTGTGSVLRGSRVAGGGGGGGLNNSRIGMVFVTSRNAAADAVIDVVDSCIASQPASSLMPSHAASLQQQPLLLTPPQRQQLWSDEGKRSREDAGQQLSYFQKYHSGASSMLPTASTATAATTTTAATVENQQQHPRRARRESLTESVDLLLGANSTRPSPSASAVAAAAVALPLPPLVAPISSLSSALYEDAEGEGLAPAAYSGSSHASQALGGRALPTLPPVVSTTLGGGSGGVATASTAAATRQLQALLSSSAPVDGCASPSLMGDANRGVSSADSGPSSLPRAVRVSSCSSSGSGSEAGRSTPALRQHPQQQQRYVFPDSYYFPGQEEEVEGEGGCEQQRHWSAEGYQSTAVERGETVSESVDMRDVGARFSSSSANDGDNGCRNSDAVDTQSDSRFSSSGVRRGDAAARVVGVDAWNACTGDDEEDGGGY